MLSLRVQPPTLRPAVLTHHRTCRRAATIRSYRKEDSEKAQPQHRKKSTEELVAEQNSGPEPGGELGRQGPGHEEVSSGSSEAQPQHRKKSIDELVAGQNSGPEPGGELGRQDPGHKEVSSGSGGRELNVDAELRSALTPLLARTRERLMERQQGEGGTVSDSEVADAAVAAAEASGAMPPLAGPQRAAVVGFFARLAADLAGGAGAAHESGGAFEPFSTSEGEGGYGFGEEDAALWIKPHHRELLEEVINFHLGSGGATRRSTSPKDSMKAGGEVGNIALQSDMHHTARVRGVPAQSESDRAERQVEMQFHQMELADLPHASTADFADQREWEAHPKSQAGNAAIEGDAPAAGGGLQAVESEEEVRQLSGTNEYSTAVDQMDWEARHKGEAGGERAGKDWE